MSCIQRIDPARTYKYIHSIAFPDITSLIYTPFLFHHSGQTNKTVLLLILVVSVAGCVGQPPVQQPLQPTVQATAPAEGRLVLGVTDKALNTSWVSSAKITVDSVAVHRAETDGWVTVETGGSRIYDLITLNQQDVTKLLGDVVLEAGVYNQIRLRISAIELKVNNTKTTAILPSSELKIPVKINVTGRGDSIVILDFDASKSLHITGNDRIVMAPVIALRGLSNVNVSVDERDRMTASGGKVVEDVVVGTDVEGNVGIGKRINANASLTIGTDGRIHEE